MNDTCDMLHHSNSDRVAAGTGIGRESSVLAMISASGARAWEQLVHGPRRVCQQMSSKIEGPSSSKCYERHQRDPTARAITTKLSLDGGLLMATTCCIHPISLIPFSLPSFTWLCLSLSSLSVRRPGRVGSWSILHSCPIEYYDSSVSTSASRLDRPDHDSTTKICHSILTEDFSTTRCRNLLLSDHYMLISALKQELTSLSARAGHTANGMISW